MSEVSKSVCSNSAASFLCTARRRRAMVAALAGLSLLASPIHGAFAASLVAEVRNIDDPGRIPFESSRSIKAGQSVFVFATVPAGHRLVVQHVSAHVNFQSVLSSSSLLDIFLSAGPGGSSFIPLFLSNSVQFDQRFSSTLTQEICPNSASQ